MTNSKIITAEYTDLAYIIRLDGKVIYQAGNSHTESQVYLPAKSGVGIKQMKEFCKQTANLFAEEYKAQVQEISQSKSSLNLKGTYVRSFGKKGKPLYEFMPIW